MNPENGSLDFPINRDPVRHEYGPPFNPNQPEQEDEDTLVSNNEPYDESFANMILDFSNPFFDPYEPVANIDTPIVTPIVLPPRSPLVIVPNSPGMDIVPQDPAPPPRTPVAPDMDIDEPAKNDMIPFASFVLSKSETMIDGISWLLKGAMEKCGMEVYVRRGSQANAKKLFANHHGTPSASDDLETSIRYPFILDLVDYIATHEDEIAEKLKTHHKDEDIKEWDLLAEYLEQDGSNIEKIVSVMKRTVNLMKTMIEDASDLIVSGGSSNVDYSAYVDRTRLIKMRNKLVESLGHLESLDIKKTIINAINVIRMKVTTWKKVRGRDREYYHKEIEDHSDQLEKAMKEQVDYKQDPPVSIEWISDHYFFYQRKIFWYKHSGSRPLTRDEKRFSELFLRTTRFLVESYKVLIFKEVNDECRFISLPSLVVINEPDPDGVRWYLPLVRGTEREAIVRSYETLEKSLEGREDVIRKRVSEIIDLIRDSQVYVINSDFETVIRDNDKVSFDDLDTLSVMIDRVNNVYVRNDLDKPAVFVQLEMDVELLRKMDKYRKTEGEELGPSIFESTLLKCITLATYVARMLLYWITYEVSAGTVTATKDFITLLIVVSVFRNLGKIAFYIETTVGSGNDELGEIFRKEINNDLTGLVFVTREISHRFLSVDVNIHDKETWYSRVHDSLNHPNKDVESDLLYLFSSYYADTSAHAIQNLSSRRGPMVHALSNDDMWDAIDER